tara:strand:+ start:95 stop:613 length:519 start_codon:yes stop_codon:yes gene_type:complete
MKIKMILLFTIFQLYSCAQESYVNYYSKKGYSFNYNNHYWLLKENQTQTFLFFKEDLEEKKEFNSNINIIIQDLSENPLTLEQYHNTTLSQIEQVLGKTAIVSDKKIEISINNARELVYTMPNQGKGFLKLKQVYFIKENKVYLITYTSKDIEYRNHLLEVDKVFKTFDAKN